MGTELLVAGLWVAVLAYWLWTRRPATADTIGVFRRELRVLRQATPARVAPANRMAPSRPAPAVGAVELGLGNPETGLPLAEHLAVTAANHRRSVMRRRRRDVLSALGGAAVVLLLLAMLTGSTALIGLDVVADLAFGGYVLLLVRAAGARPAASVPREARAPRRARAAARQGEATRRRSRPTEWLEPTEAEPEPYGAGHRYEVQGPHLFDQEAYADQVNRGRGFVPGPLAAAPRSRPDVAPPRPLSFVPPAPVRRPHPAPPRWTGEAAPAAVAAPSPASWPGQEGSGADDDLAYGDFDSYASLALAQAN